MDTVPSFVPAPCPVPDTACLPFLAGLVDDLPVGICLLDRDLRVVCITRWLVDAHGASMTGYLGRPMADLLPAAFAGIEHALQRAFRGKPVDDVVIPLPADGATRQPRVHLASLRPVLAEGGAVTGVLVLVSDIARRELAEAPPAGASVSPNGSGMRTSSWQHASPRCWNGSRTASWSSTGNGVSST